ncbi:alpha-amylase family protein [Phytoactinopolyspora halotolerans]|uniref:Family 10 glycosylhydrolase n=1 Tax=Phytoactinopolyspora halotolerans TaxID=1981512 RepID=A0A6L9S4A2_9ACTN|nr:alpha-amylase family protein [Phytoactinopolyspora halotolerans]NED99908.1 family 10 glycosylhydrolase [Phytoactinopolyspora halotolerans]
MALDVTAGEISASGAVLRTPDWHLTATRWTQLTLVENDPVNFDPEFWIEVMRRTRSNAACISAGGYIAFYPTKIPYHYRSAYLGDTDPFGALVEGARRLGMHVMARVDPHAVHADAAAAHPEWLALTADGTPIEHWGYPDIWLTCPFGPYNREFITEVAREIVSTYDVDAIFANRWQGHGISYSEAARRSFRDETGFSLPEGEHDGRDPAWRAYADWRRRKLSELVGIWDNAVKDIRPHARFIPNLGGVTARDLDRELVEKHYPIFFIDKQGRSGVEVPWSAGRNGKRSRAMFRDRPVGLITSVGPEHHQHRWKDSVTSGAEVSTWIVDGFAHGAFPWFTKFNGTVSDPRWVQPVADAFRLHAQLEPHLSSMRITADVALFEPTTSTGPSSGSSGPYAHENGFYHALVEARIPFELVSDQNLTDEELARFRVLVLANAERLTDEQCSTIREFVRAGGGLVAAHHSSLGDDLGARRSNFGLADVFGVDLERPARGPVKNNYIAITADHPISDGYGGASRIIGGTELIHVEERPGTVVPFRFVPDFPDLPMEEVYARAEPSLPAVVAHEPPGGGGRSVYLPFNVGSLFWEELQPDHGRLIANAVRWASAAPDRVRVDGPGLIDVAVWEGAGELAVVAVNLTNPMAMKGPIREIVSVGPIQVAVRLPVGVSGADARLLVADTGAEVEIAAAEGGQEGADGGGLVATVTMPSVELLEVARLSWRRA